MRFAIAWIISVVLLCANCSHVRFRSIQEDLSFLVERGLRNEAAIRALVNSANEISALCTKYLNLNINTRYWTSHAWSPNYKKQTGSARGNLFGTRYDFIVVGSGSSGSVIANRLSEVPDWQILLIEIGEPETRLMKVPQAAPLFQFTPYNWEYYAEYEPNICAGLENQKMHWPRGKALGGTSTINYMIYTRGNPIDYNNWEAQGNPGWSYKDVLPYYLKSEKSSLRKEDPAFHNHDGYLSVSDSYQSILLNAFIKAGNELGLPTIDYNSAVTPFGVSTIQATLKKGRRHSAASAFLVPIKDRPNLHILSPAYVTKVLINPETRSTYGVECEFNGKIHEIKAEKEVILSAGAFNSPQLLMLSGIGHTDHLTELGIPVLQDLPVGDNLHDHLTFPGLAFLINRTISTSPTTVINVASFNNYYFNGTGPLTSLGGVEGIGYIKTEYATEPGTQPDMELLFIGGSITSDYGLFVRRGLKITDRVYDGLMRPIHAIPNWTVFPMLLHPKSIGYMRLRSKNPKDYPLFYGRFFSDPGNRDIKAFISAIRFVQELSRTNSFQRFDSRLNPHVQPGCESYAFDSDDYWECCLRAISVTLHHQVGTAKMGPPNDPTSVVNHELKVYGINRLRVADCSIIPFALSAHTNVPAMMVGEKAADMIKADWS